MSDAWIEINEGSGPRRVPIEKAVFTAGRQAGNDLKLSAADISREHAEIVRDGDRFLIRDRQSRFGTFVNAARVTEQILKHGDVVRLGQSGGVEMVFFCEPVAQLPEPAVDRAVPGEERQDRAPSPPEAVARVLQPGVLGPELQAALDGADGPLALVERQVDAGLVQQEVRVGAGAAQRLVAEDHAQVAVPLDEDQREPVPGHVPGIARILAVGPLEGLWPPWVPIHRIESMLLQIGAGGVEQVVGARFGHGGDSL